MFSAAQTSGSGRSPPAKSMSTHLFVCPECTQEIEVNGPMREAILSGGCPVCAASAEAACFEALSEH